MKRIGTMMAVLGLLVLLAAPNSAKAAKGFYLSAGLGSAVPTMSGDWIDEMDPGAGVSMDLLNLGYAFDKNWAMGLYWGAGSGGINESFMGDNGTWGEGYMGLNARYFFDNDKPLVPYVELGLGGYNFSATSDDYAIVPDSMEAGFKIAGGLNYYFGRNQGWFVNPELAFHYVQTNGESEVDDDGGDKIGTIDLDENTSMVTLMIRLGYHWKHK
jgi:hypothetical protein